VDKELSRAKGGRYEEEELMRKEGTKKGKKDGTKEGSSER
jgi:hypothetical protein